jgi:uncharacterized membrane protein YgcG
MSQHTRQAEHPETRTTDAHRDVRLETLRPPRFDLSVPKILAGALAAASAAVAASWLGVAGTVLGAVVASIVVSITSAVYSHPIEKSTQVIREVLPVRPDPYRLSSGSMSTETLVLDSSRDVGGDSAEPAEATSTALPANSARETLSHPRRISWGTVVVSSVLALIVGFGALTAVEAVLGQSASSLTGDHHGGTTIGSIFDGGSENSGGSGGDDPDRPAPTSSDPTDETPTTSDPTDSPTTEDPTTSDPTPSEPTPTEPTQTQPTDAQTTGNDVGGSELAAAPRLSMVS